MKQKKQKQKAKNGKETLSKVEESMLMSFFPEGREKTIKQLMETADYSYERANTGLKLLKDKKIITEKKIGSTLTYSMDFKNIYSKMAYFNFINDRLIQFAKKHNPIYNLLKKIDNKTDVLILFGSYSKGTETEKSDIDVLGVSDDKDKIEREIHSLKYSTGKTFSPIIIPKEEFPKIKKENPELWHDIIKYGIVFKGLETLYSIGYEHELN